MTEIFKAIEDIAIEIYEAIKTKDTGKVETQNASGDVQVKLDVISDDIVEKHLLKVKSVKEIISEEKEDPITKEEGEYFVAYDPLDGSSLIDVDLSVGSIFGIYKGGYNGENIVAAAYVVYGPRVELVIARDVVELFRLNEHTKKFEFVKELKLGKKGKILGPGGTQKNWYPFHKEMIDSFFAEGYRLRYSGGMVPDLHQILLKGGGLFAYPGTTDKPKGKLRKLFEVFPFACVYERAGGKAVDGFNELLSLEAESYHDTTPCFFGSEEEIIKVLRTYKENQ
ncbi:class 1 fructose-bisphosphatase [Caminibacter pacificus]|jgi:fructose-1,6-bisphosphatase I|uniref:Fructose-1,6-bisphosphatase class 1 n=1 Tax=Caminibacter pacificus TaxID=1424653 RepID=A0AAJ4REJ7_9BACT|nr:class 1 fructose-bisphosphatase [Caminibacter pacificus]NPA87808.1 class 1 fructose-bisphosphatase [Campylobacterota bacterium]QCI28176.1 class 1 fructose-bisphosphatase [Caminibacter pacificus]ROR41111.1 fructose-1,6-bisphosphatase I [Caminibacter pacificus]